MSRPRLSGYTTSYDAVSRGYPLRECVTQLRAFCDEVVIADGGSRDGTLDLLADLARADRGVRVARHAVDFGDPRWALALDGGLKAAARALCRGELCWQADLDEIPADDAAPAIHALIARWPSDWCVLAVPFVEYWGSLDRVRIDVRPCFPRLSRNHPDITHGVPWQHRRFDRAGRLYAAPYHSDSCDYIHRTSYDALPIVALVPGELEALRIAAQVATPAGLLARSRFQVAFGMLLERAPCVFHLSWLDIARKLRHYREHWPRFHASLFDRPQDARTPSLFDKPWDEVSDAEIDAKAAQLADEGPRVLHGTAPRIGPTIRCGKLPPAVVHDWIERHSLEPLWA